MLSTSARTAFGKNLFNFSTKKKQMELTLRTPYRTILSEFTGFSRVITKTQESALVVQNKNPGELVILPPGSIRLKLNQDVKGVSDEYLHTGGWLITHTYFKHNFRDNSCEINLMDVVETNQVRADQIDKVDVKDPDNGTAKYISKARRGTSRVFAKRAA